MSNNAELLARLDLRSQVHPLIQEAAAAIRILQAELFAYNAIINDDGSLDTFELRLSVLQDMAASFAHASEWEAQEAEIARLRAALAQSRQEPAAVALSAKDLRIGWAKYTEAFGVPPHGTEKQMAALIQLSGHAAPSQPTKP